ncbi:hypothetical protein NDA16_001455 [Ustilago loliicola]|nr:hypothetical protein NDA16_001455 [Ustilago loliicola]
MQNKTQTVEDKDMLEAVGKHLAEQFRRPYRGDAHLRFLRFVINVHWDFYRNEMYRPSYQGTPIIQSSGTGKTRMILELGSIAPLFYLRPGSKDADAQSGYPLPDSHLQNFYSTSTIRPTVDSQERMVIFLAAWFTVLAKDLADLDVEGKIKYIADLNAYGRQTIVEDRKQFFQKVHGEAEHLLQRNDEEESVESWLQEWGIYNRYGRMLYQLMRACWPTAGIDLLQDTSSDLMMRIALMAAWDAVKKSELNKGIDALEERATLLLQPVKVTDILLNLARLEGASYQAISNKIDEARLKVDPKANSDQVGVQAWTHFTHFDMLDECVTEISPEYLWYCWKRGVALQLSFKQRGIDGIIPVYVGDIMLEFKASATHQGSGQMAAVDVEAAKNMTYIAWAAKNPQKRDAIHSDVQDLAGPKLMRLPCNETALTTRGLLTVVADLDVPEKEPQVEEIAGTGSVQLRIQGHKEEYNFSCFDTLQIRKVFGDFLAKLANRRYPADENFVHSPLDTSKIHPRMLTVVDGQPKGEAEVLEDDGRKD